MCILFSFNIIPMRLIVWEEKIILRINIKILFLEIYLLKISLALMYNLIHFLD